MVTRWVEALGWESTLNRRSTTWRELPAKDRDDLDALKAKRLLIQYPTLAKRPIFEKNGGIINGFSKDVQTWLHS
jgi:arsenate reductase-like glutaredoxin family protein